MVRVASAALVLALGAAVAGAATPPRVTVGKPPPRLHVGEVWLAAVRAPRGSTFLVVRGSTMRTAPITRGRARVVFPSPGRWRYGVRVGNRRVLVGSLDVRPRVPTLAEPFDVLVRPGGSLLVADRRAGALLSIDPRTRDGEVVLRLPEPRALATALDGRVLVASGVRVVAIDLANGRTEELLRAEETVLGIAADLDGALYASDGGGRILRRHPTGAVEVVASGLDGVHGMLAAPTGIYVAESFGGRVLVLRPETGALDVIAEGLANPSYLALAGESLYVTEFGAGRVSRLSAGGGSVAAAPVARPAGLAADGDGTLVVASLTGAIFRVDPAAGIARRIYP